MVLGFIPDTLGVAVLVSAILAGLRRSTGQTLKVAKIRNSAGRQALGLYLSVGEWVMDRLTSYARGSRYFQYDANATIEWAKKQPQTFVEGLQANLGDLAAEITGYGRDIHGDVRKRNVESDEE